MRIHAALMLPIGRVIVFENGVRVIDCRLNDLRYTLDPHEFIDVFLNPNAIPAIEEMFFPTTKRRLN